MGVGGEPVNTVVDSIVSQSSDTIRDDAITVDDRVSRDALPLRGKTANDTVPESPTVDVLAAPTGDPAGDSVVDSAPGAAPVLEAVHSVDALDLVDTVDSGLGPDLDDTADLRDSAELDDIAALDAEAPDEGQGTADDNESAGGDDNEVKNLEVSGEPPDIDTRPTDVTETLEASALLSEVAFATEEIAPEVLTAEMLTAEAFPAQGRRSPAVWDAADAVTEIYHVHYNQFVRLAVLLLHDVQTAEEVVQDAFEAMHVAWRRLNDKDKALQYLRQTVVNKSRSVLRHRKVVDMHAPKPAPDEPSAEQGALVLLERSAVAAALRSLPERQREAIALRYYADFSEADIAKAMGISKGAVKSHTARAMATLKTVLTQATS